MLGAARLDSLPYDLLLNIAGRLELGDVHRLHLTCRALYAFSISRPVYRHIAAALLRRSRALPLKGFQRITDLSTPQLIRAVNKAARYEASWQRRAPRPIPVVQSSHINEHSNYMDGSSSNLWYKVVSAPPGEDVDWLSPITSSYTLCATKTGKVVCWDVQTDRCLAEWSPGERWELWKCRVEFEEKTVYFTMAKVLVPRNDDTRLMDFVLMRLRFFDGNTGESAQTLPIFEHVTEFKTRGVVMNVFLLDPISRLLSAFIYANGTNTICLYALLDWDKPEYIFIDTGIECVPSSNWSCILYEQNIVIHCEETHGAFQYFYPLHLLEVFTKPLLSKSDIPRISYRVSPAVSLHRKFIFPQLEPHPTNGATPTPTPTTPQTNPYPFPLWCPDSAHFVRQWWPSLPGIPRISCTVVLLATHDPDTHRTRFMLAQHYFRVPLARAEWDLDANAAIPELVRKLVGPPHALRAPGEREGGRGVKPIRGKRQEEVEQQQQQQDVEDVDDAALMHLWYVETPFEVVCVAETTEDGEGEGDGDADGDADVVDGEMERPRPLVAVDFGHAAWIEFVDNEDDLGRPRVRAEDADAKWLRFVTFPPFDERLGAGVAGGEEWARTGGVVRTLETPPDLDLDMVETINIDQSQGAVILSVRDGMIFILCYE